MTSVGLGGMAYYPYKMPDENPIPFGVLCCGNCSWFDRNHCLNPKNARNGSAGSEYSRSDVFEPMYVTKNKVCQRHETFDKPDLREVFPLYGEAK